MTEKLITHSNKLMIIDQIIESVTEPSNTVFYLFAGKNTQYDGGDSIIEVPLDTDAYMNKIYSDMLFGKRISGTDVMHMIPRYNWQSGTIYDQYDDEDSEMFNKVFYSIVDAGSFRHVWKCLYNNLRSESTIEPDFGAVTSSDTYYESSDGYVWKYLYSIPRAQVLKFATDTLFPVTSNSQVAESRTKGTIEMMVVESIGSGYNNYLSGNNEFGPNDRNLSGNTLLYDISANSSASSSNNYYNGCYIYIKTGNNDEAGQFKKIVGYQVNSSSKAIVVESPFAQTIGIGATYDIYPGVIIIGDGKENVNAVARAVINSNSNSVHKIEMLNFGEGYKKASATIDVDSQLIVDEASIRPIKSPWNGHGYDPMIELGSDAMMISVAFNGSESGNILSSNEFRTIGLLRDPAFANVVVNLEDEPRSNFIVGENVYKLSPYRLGTNATINTTSTSVSDPNGDFVNQFSSGDNILLTYSSSNSVANSAMFGTINAISNSSLMTLTTNASFSKIDGGVYYYKPEPSLIGYVTTSNSSAVVLENVVSAVTGNDTIIGVLSGTMATVNSISRNGTTKSFSTFINTDKYVGTISFGSFEEDEIIRQNSSNAYGILHSVVSNTNFYVVSQYSDFIIGENIVGDNSEAIAEIEEKYSPELIYRSGDILYIENQEPVTRSSDQSETFKITLRF